MDVSEFNRELFPVVMYDFKGLFVQFGSPNNRTFVGSDVAVVACKSLASIYEGLAERHRELEDLFRDFDHTDLTEMVDTVMNWIGATADVLELYKRHGARKWVADEKTLHKAYLTFLEADKKVTKTAKETFKLLLGELNTDFVPPPMPLETWTEPIRKSKFFLSYMADKLLKRHGLSRTVLLAGMVSDTFLTHKDLMEFIYRNEYHTMPSRAPKPGERISVYNYRDEVVGAFQRTLNPLGRDGWRFKFIQLDYKGEKDGD